MNRRLFVLGGAALGALAVPGLSAFAQSDLETANVTFNYKGRTHDGVFVYTFIVIDGETVANAKLGFKQFEGELKAAMLDFWKDNEDVELEEVTIEEFSSTHTLGTVPVISPDYDFTFAMDLRRVDEYLFITMCLGGDDAVEDMTEFLDEFEPYDEPSGAVEDMLPTEDDLPAGYNIVENEETE